MKFTCESCSAQYMISDEKVGPAGVKVRCKKCGNVIVVRRASDGAAPAAAAPTAGEGGGLDVELGQAFDSAFGDTPAPNGAAAASPDLSATQAMGAEDQARIAAAPQAAATEWYVAIGQAQVGPLPLAEVKKKWEAGDVGPDSLVWRPGMGDWSPLSSVAELASQLAPVPRPAPQASRAEPTAPRVELARERAAATPAPVAAAPAQDVNWKPSGASALAALASEEIATRNAPEPKPAARNTAVPSGVKSLVDALPDGGGVDPTGAIPLSIKGLDTTGEKKLEQRRSAVASRAEEARHRRSVTRAVFVGVVVVIAVVGGALAYFMTQMRKLEQPAAVVAAAPAPAQRAAPPAPVAPPPAAAAPAAAAPAPAAPVAQAAPPPPAAAEKAPEPPAAKEPPRTAAKAEPPPARHVPGKKEREPAKPPPAPAKVAEAPPPPAPPPAKKKDSLLDFDSGSDSALDDALGGKPSGRSVYVPPAPAGTGALPEKLSQAQINEGVAGRIDMLRKCASDQKARDPGTSGVLKMRWLIGGDGAVRDVKCMTPEFATTPFAQCIGGVVRTIKFPRSKTTGQEVTFPFSF